MTTTPIPLPPGAVHVENWEGSADERVTRSFRGTAYTAAAIKGGGRRAIMRFAPRMVRCDIQQRPTAGHGK